MLIESVSISMQKIARKMHVFRVRMARLCCLHAHGGHGRDGNHGGGGSVESNTVGIYRDIPCKFLDQKRVQNHPGAAFLFAQSTWRGLFRGASDAEKNGRRHRRSKVQQSLPPGVFVSLYPRRTWEYHIYAPGCKLDSAPSC